MTAILKRGRTGVLSAAIDPFLLEGGRTVSEIADVLFEKFGGQTTKLKLINNVRSRIFFLQKSHNFRLEKGSDRRVRLIEIVEAPVTESTVQA